MRDKEFKPRTTFFYFGMTEEAYKSAQMQADLLARFGGGNQQAQAQGTSWIGIFGGFSGGLGL